MQTRVLKVDAHQPEPEAIHAAAEMLRAGRLVAFPTETVYGLGANALDSAAIDRIYAAKQRPASDPIIAHIHEISQLYMLAVAVPDSVDVLIDQLWPGPLTLVLKRASGVPANIATGMPTVAIRMPAHPVARALLQAADTPIAAPSANTFTRPSATTAAHVLEDLQGRVDLILDGGAATGGMESTVLDMTQFPPVVLRPGGVLLEDLQALLPDVLLLQRYVDASQHTSAPGQMLKHYSPRARILLFTGEHAAVIEAMQAHLEAYASDRAGVMVLDDECRHFEGLAIVAPMGQTLTEIGQNLFATMRHLDAYNVDVILVRDFGREGLGVAVWDRLLRAAEGHVIRV